MNSVGLLTDPNQLKLSQLSIVEEKPHSKSTTEEINNDELENNIVTEENVESSNNVTNGEKKPSAAHCSNWLQKTDFSVADSIDSESIVSEVYDTDDASSIADSDIHQAIDPNFSLMKKYRQVGDLTEDKNVNNTFVDSSGNSFKNINVQNSEKVYVGNVTNINIYKVKENKKPKKREESTVEMEECIPDNIFLKSKVSDNTIRPLYIIPRVRWLAQRAIDFEEFNHIPKFVVISHTATEPASSIAENVPLVRDIQSFHIESRKWSDIAYNFLIGEDGNVYEGRGWKRVGAHTLGYNKVAIGISFIGCYMTSTPPDRSLRTLSLLLEVAVKEKHITADYGLLGHCQCSPVESPGKALFAILKEHPHWIADPLPPE